MWKSRVTPRTSLWLLLTLTLLKGITWSIIIPPWHAPDENTHFLYAQMLLRDRTMHPTNSYWIPLEIGISWELTQMGRVRYNPGTWFDFSDRDKIADELRQLEDPTATQNALLPDPLGNRNFRDFTYSRPPFYYFMATAPQALFQASTIFVRVLDDRWLSVFLGVITVVIAYRAGRAIWQNDAWALLLATLVSFQPMLTFCMAIINSQALEIALFSAVLLVSLQIIRSGLSGRRSLILGLVVGLGLLTRPSFLSSLPLVGLLFIWKVTCLNRSKHLDSKTLSPWIWIWLLPLLMAGWWYKGFLAPGENPTEGIYGPITESYKMNGLEYLLNYDWLNTYRLILDMYWGNFGWLDTPMPQSLATFLTSVTIVAVAITGFGLVRRVFSNSGVDPKRTFILFILGIATCNIITFYTFLDYRLSGDPLIHYGFQGRYFISPIIAQMAWLAIGLVWLAPQRLRRAWMWLLAVGMVAVNLYALFGVITLRYYGARNLWLVADRAAVLQPLSANTILVLCIGFLALTGAFLLSLLPAFKNASNAI